MGITKPDKLIKELKAFKYKTEYPGDVNDHAADAIRYMLINHKPEYRHPKTPWGKIILLIILAIIYVIGLLFATDVINLSQL